MTTDQHATATGEAEAVPLACGCRNGDPAASLAIQRDLVERAIRHDPVAVGDLFDRYADDVYGYVLAWTRDVEVAERLTERVFRDVLSWLPVMQQGEGELAAWLIAMARDAVAHGHGARPAAIDPTDPAQAVSLLDDPERELVVFRLLLGHSLLHSAHLAGYRPRVSKALQLIACSTLWRNSVDPTAASAAAAASAGEQADRSDDPATPPPYYLDPRHDRRRADAFEQRLNEPWGSEVIKGDDPELDNAMTVASALRLAAPNVVPPPEPAFLARVREALAAEAGGQASPPEPSSPAPQRAARNEGARSRRGAGLLVAFASTRRLQLLAVLAALVVGVTAAVVVSANLSGQKSKCGSGGCLASATTASPSSVLGSTVPSRPPATVAPSSTTAATAPVATAPPTTRARLTATTGAPATTEQRPTTTRRQTTTTRQPPTTLPPTTATTTTTTLAPQP